MRRKKLFNHSYFEETAVANTRGYIFYLDRLTELAISMFDWQGLPEEIDERFLERTLFIDGRALFFRDEIAEQYAALQFTDGGGFTMYGLPLSRNAYAVNGYRYNGLTPQNSIVIYNSMLRGNTYPQIELYARRLWFYDAIIDMNVNAQKTPVLLQGTEQQRTTLLNLYMQYDGNSPFIFGSKDLDINSLKAITTGAPYLGDKLYQLKSNVWNEALTYLGISNIQVNKKERLVSDEVMRYQGGVVASRYSRLCARRRAADEINHMFGLDVVIDYREDFDNIGGPDEGRDAFEGGDPENE